MPEENENSSSQFSSSSYESNELQIPKKEMDIISLAHTLITSGM